jgi:predicted PurR-regulated permease PerM
MIHPTDPDLLTAADAEALAASPLLAAAVQADVKQMLEDDRKTLLALNKGIHRLLTVLVVGGVLYTCYLASDLFLPVLFAAFLALLLSPINARMSRGFLPRWLTALCLVLCLIAGMAGIGTMLYRPAINWMHKAPILLSQTAPKLRAMIRPIQEASKAGDTLGNIAGDAHAKPPLVVDTTPHASLLATTPRVLASVLAVILLTYFFLLYGEEMLRKALMLGPTLSKKRITLDIVRAIQSDLSRYVLTICATSALLGLSTGLYLWWRGVDDPVLWGTLAALLNLTPYVGPMLMAGLLVLVGLSEFNGLAQAALPAAGFLFLHLMESQFVTPQALGRAFKVSPLAIILWLMIWGWLWGILGLLLAVPMLVCVKIICSRVESLQTWAMLIED